MNLNNILYKIRSKKHLTFIRSLPCMIVISGENCNNNSIAHHLTFCGGQGRGTKESDSKTVPLCPYHHSMLHNIGEKEFWKQVGIPLKMVEAYADKLWSKSNGH